MRERPRFDENQIADRNEFNVRAGRAKIPACALVVRFIVICGGVCGANHFRGEISGAKAAGKNHRSWRLK
jgi:hypothetical protein